MTGRRFACIVEGQGDANAVPVLIRRLAALDPELAHPLFQQRDILRLPRSRLVRQGELERAVDLAARRTGSGGAVLVLLDADDDWACRLGPSLLGRARSARPDVRLAVVLAVREYEAWFLATAPSLRGVCGLDEDLQSPADPERVRDAKGWLTQHMTGHRYRETLHQAKLTAQMELTGSAGDCASLAKLRRDVHYLLSRDPEATTD